MKTAAGAEKETEVVIPAGGVTLSGSLSIPQEARGIAVFAHGSGSGRFSPRNRYVAGVLQQAGLGTLLMDLLTPDEEEVDLLTAEKRFDIELLSGRVTAAVDWLQGSAGTGALSIGCFGARTGAAAALIAAARRPSAVKAVVSRGGRPDLAGEALRGVRAPTLLIVGGDDTQVIEINRGAYEQLETEKEFLIVPGATHLFEEPGTLEQAAGAAAAWFKRYL